ncbi:MAG: hypothetical protein JWN24_1609 [Phycisphaerales bacterium]|nr:hypothetical protein [Phycisphaerales bacterium]
MNRILLTVAGVFGASSLLLVDSAVKGTALLLLAAVAALILRRDSAATRHVVWLLAIVALLAVPVLSAMLPQWRVLPQWAGISPKPLAANISPASTARPAEGAVESPRIAEPVQVERSSATANEPAAEPPAPSPAPATPKIIPEPPSRSWNWINALPLVWAIGFSVLILRLVAARLMLWNSERQGTVVGSSGQPAKAIGDPIVTALEAACSQLGIRRPVTLLIHADKTIPVVWGIRRCSLLLPAAARHWSGEQLRSVLLHELAHIKRRDTMAQLLTQIACALHWFNPLVWFAAWRLGVERERACDDLVLASGVRPSAYAGFLLEVVTGYASARWTTSCGLAMARKSSLEGRLIAVVSKNLNRRGVSAALAAIALVMTVGIVIPIAMLRAAEEGPAAPAQRKDSKKPEAAVKLDPKTEEKLKWGEPVNGLRAALVIRTSPDDANAGGTPDLYLLVQNVSDAPIHLNDTTAAPELRYLTVQRDDVPQSRTRIDVPTLTDATLRPREAAFLLMVPRGATPSKGQLLAAGMLKEPHMVLFGQINIEKAPAGAWTGKLATGATNGAAATPAEQPKVAAETPKSGGAVQPKPEAAQLPGAPVQQQGAQKLKGAAKLQPATEAKLEWGEPVNGLRMALAWPPALGEPAAGDVADFYLAVQNASKTAVRLCTTVDAPHERWLDIKEKDRIVSRIGSKEPNGVDVTLQSQEVAFLRLFQEAVKDPNGASAGAAIASDIRQSTRYQLNAALKVDKAPAGAWTGTVTTPNTRAGVGAEAPKNRKAQELLKVWLHDARLSGKIPGGFIARLGEHMKAFVKGNAADAAGAPFAKRMEPLLPRLDGSRDWQPVDAAALLNDIAAVSDAPLSVMLEEIVGGKVQHGLPLPPELEKAPWGEPVGHGVGLRTATIVGPGIESKLQYVDWIGGVVTEGRAAADKAAVNAAGAEIRLGTPLGCRILVHNAGKEPVVFRTRTWHHIEPTAKDAKGAEIGMESVTRFTRAPLVTFRLEPGRYIELASPGFGLGKYGFHDFKNADIASWIGAKEGDDVSLTPGVLPLLDWNEERTLLLDGEPRWWLDFIAARLSLVTPLPTDAAERKALLRRVMWDIYLQGTDPTEEESAAFVSDTSTQALTKLAERLFHRTGVRVWAGPLQSGPTKFRVLPADPKAPKPPEGPAAAPAPGSRPSRATTSR